MGGPKISITFALGIGIPLCLMKRRDKIIIGIVVACLAVAAGTWMDVRQGRRMHAALELALAQNRSGVPFRSDTIYLDSDSTDAVTLHHVVDFYRHPLRRFLARHASFLTPHSSLKGEADNSSFVTRHSSFLMQSLYVLGCVHRDLHEAPMAIITWEEAIAAADTTADDCDYATLYRVYGQMADMYMWQHLPEKELEAQLMMKHYSFLAGDTLNAIRGQLLCNSAYYALRDTAAIFANSEAVRQQYLNLGLTKEAAKVYPTPIHVAVEHRQYERARKMMDEYERHSGLFGADGFISDTTRIQYHSYKGNYYLGIHEIDSAERQFRHIMPFQSTAISAYRGLMAVYNEKRNVDSVQKYSTLFENQVADIMKESKNTAIIQAEGMYDYSRHQLIAQREKEKVRQRDLAVLVSSVVLVALIIIFFYYNKKVKLQKKVKDLEYNELVNSYHAAIEQLEATQNDVVILQQETIKNKETQDLLQKKEEQVIELKKLVNELRKRLKYSPRHELQSNIKEADIVEHFHLICKSHFEGDKNGRQSIPPRKASEHEWKSISLHTRIADPSFYLFISEHKLSDLERKVCLLVKYGFKNPEIATLTGSHKHSLSNARRSLAHNLFGLSSAYDLDKQIANI